jgi:hypothetical protein
MSFSLSQKAGSVFYCLADPAPGTFTVPAYVLNAMVASDAGGLPGIAAGSLSVGGVLEPASFTAPTLDLGIFSVSGIDVKMLNYQ